jgi:Flp pilus assembly protein TadG
MQQQQYDIRGCGESGAGRSGNHHSVLPLQREHIFRRIGAERQLLYPVAAYGDGAMRARAGLRQLRRRMVAGERGGTIVELAVVLPVALFVFTGMLQFGLVINKRLELMNATSLAAQYLSVNRGTAAAADPCNLTVTAFKQVSPFLISSNVSFSFAFQPVGATSATNYSGTTCTGGASVFTQGGTAQVSTTYPCSLAVYGVNLGPSCSLHAQVTEVIQ